MSGLSLGNLQLPASAILGAIAAAVYLLSRLRHRRATFTLLDAMILVCIMAIVTATAMPWLDAASASATSSALQENLRTLRSQIELYKLEHGGTPPLLFKGGFPQLMHATNAKGFPGPPGREYPYGPYLRSGVPLNPYTGTCEVQMIGEFPPEETGGVTGWLYHQETGRIAPDLSQDIDQ